MQALVPPFLPFFFLTSYKLLIYNVIFSAAGGAKLVKDYPGIRENDILANDGYPETTF
jgi:hypothetical protein